jgi:hypothetical protein
MVSWLFEEKGPRSPASCFMFHHLYSQDATGMALGTQRKVTGKIFDFALASQCKKPWQKETSDPLSNV